ncbi:MAG: von Willebrand factor type A domain-containing protein [Pseudomonadota bacterium]
MAPRVHRSFLPIAALLAVGGLATVCTLWLGAGVGLMPEEPPAPAIDEIPDRFAEVLLAEPPAASVHAQGVEGAHAPRATPASPAVAVASEAMSSKATRRAVDKEIAENKGVLGALRDGSELDAAIGEGIGGLIGAKGVQVGSGGLGTRGTGLGGGGSATGLGGLGTRGRGTGAGYIGHRLERERRGDLGSEQYTDYGQNQITLVTDDPLSTFSIDVDTASYAIARRKLHSGHLPPPSAVRVEEFVNSFAYDYRAPRDGAPFAVHMEAAPSPYQPGHHLLRVGIKGREVDPTHRAPARLTFLVDVSGSMNSDDKLGLARQALHVLVNELGSEDSVAIATYAGRVARVLPPTPTTRRATIHSAIDSLRSGGSTAMDSGIDLAYQMASEAFVAGAENRVVVLSDGDANVGPASHTAILETIHAYAGRGITLSTVGFGMGNYKDTLMEQLADRGDGNYSYVDGLQEAEKVFGRDLAGTIQTIARDVKIQVEFDPEAVLAYRLVGYENRDIADKDFRDDKVDAGEVGSGHRVTALYDVVLADSGTSHLATVRIRAKPPGPDAPAAEWATPFPRSALDASFADASADLRLATAAAGFAEKLRGSRSLEEVSYREVAEIVRGAMRGHHSEDGELLELVEQAADLAGEGALAAR